MREKILNVPNILTFYRLAAFPVILGFIVYGKESLFVIFMIVNFLTDIADGYIARKFKLETEFGARLDSIADNLTYALAIVGIYVFKREEFLPYVVSFSVFVGFLLLTIIVSLIKFRRLPSFHLYLTKAGGYIQGAFFICLFTIGFIPLFYYIMICWGILGALEHIAIQLVIPEMRSNVKGIYWVLKDRKEQKT
ncbi:MAG: CDP-alcohol phosphatidyltransferase family protein [Bacteroidales bacterium]|nr:CDP-alcohol phosphatidyltransferase family protein [Bacteroidales bacterium]MDD3989159.1 CDP-alcohol phosphatidyltransferase family protein [Bacteroidales bacterium]